DLSAADELLVPGGGTVTLTGDQLGQFHGHLDNAGGTVVAILTGDVSEDDLSDATALSVPANGTVTLSAFQLDHFGGSLTRGSDSAVDVRLFGDVSAYNLSSASTVVLDAGDSATLTGAAFLSLPRPYVNSGVLT